MVTKFSQCNMGDNHSTFLIKLLWRFTLYSIGLLRSCLDPDLSKVFSPILQLQWYNFSSVLDVSSTTWVHTNWPATGCILDDRLQSMYPQGTTWYAWCCLVYFFTLIVYHSGPFPITCFWDILQFPQSYF